MIQKNKNIIFIALAFFTLFLYSPLMQGAKMAMAVKKNFVFQAADAQAIADLLHLSNSQNYKLRLSSALEWAAYLRDDPHPDASSSGVERPQFNQISYDASSKRLELSGNWFDKNTGIPIQDYTRYYFISPSFSLTDFPKSDWGKLVAGVLPSRLVKDENNPGFETVFQKKIKLSANEFELRILLVWDYSQNVKKPALQVNIGVEGI